MGLRIIMAVCYLPIVLIIAGVTYSEGIPKGNILMGVTLWKGGLGEAEVKRIQKCYNRELAFVTLLVLLMFALTCAPPRDSVVIAAQMLWLIAAIVLLSQPLVRANRSLMTLKREHCHGNGPKKDAVTPDLKAPAMPRSKNFLKLTLLGAAVSCIAPAAFFFTAGDKSMPGTAVLLYMSGAGAVCFLTLLCFHGRKTEAAGYKSRINVQLACVRRLQWSRFWCIAVWMYAAFTLLVRYAMEHIDTSFLIMLSGTLVYMAVITGAAVFSEMCIHKCCRNLMQEEKIEPDEDAHWIYGIFYYNKNDTRFMVSKRVGVGTTVNMAKRSGKVFVYGSGIGSVLVLLICSIWVLSEDLAPIHVSVQENQLVSGQFTDKYAIDLQDVKRAELIGELPSMKKRVGSSMDTVKKGSFMAEGYESCKVLVRLKKPPFLRIEAADGMVYYLNDENTDQTIEIFDQLERIEK